MKTEVMILALTETSSDALASNELQDVQHVSADLARAAA